MKKLIPLLVLFIFLQQPAHAASASDIVRKILNIGYTANYIRGDINSHYNSRNNNNQYIPPSNCRIVTDPNTGQQYQVCPIANQPSNDYGSPPTSGELYRRSPSNYMYYPRYYFQQIYGRTWTTNPQAAPQSNGELLKK